MHAIPRLIATSVIRGSQQNESHGGLCVVDLERGAVEFRLDWNRADIDTSGRGGDRGLRGVVVHGDRILAATNAEILVFDRDFRLLEGLRNRYLGHCHEISVHESLLYITSTAYDSIVVADLTTGRFTRAFHLSRVANRLRLQSFDPESDLGPQPNRVFHLNSVHASGGTIQFSGLYTPGLLQTDGHSLSMLAPLPEGTHNARLVDGGLLYNDTCAGRLCYRAAEMSVDVPVPEFPREQIVNIDRFESTVARPGFARGLCVVAPGIVAGGSSPSTVALYDLERGVRAAMLNISMDVRNAIHGLAVWPF